LANTSGGSSALLILAAPFEYLMVNESSDCRSTDHESKTRPSESSKGGADAFATATVKPNPIIKIPMRGLFPAKAWRNTGTTDERNLGETGESDLCVGKEKYRHHTHAAFLTFRKKDGTRYCI
jgi:hypothetical protein